MKNVKVPTSDSYHTYLIASLQDPEEAAGYLEAILEEPDPEPELLKRALSNVAEALSQKQLSIEQAKLHSQSLDQVLSPFESIAIFKLGTWLKTLGLKLTITVCEDTKH